MAQTAARPQRKRGKGGFDGGAKIVPVSKRLVWWVLDCSTLRVVVSNFLGNMHPALLHLASQHAITLCLMYLNARYPAPTQ
jgi:hypothetical protein